MAANYIHIQDLENQIKEIDDALTAGKEQREGAAKTCETLAMLHGGLHPESLAAVEDVNEMDKVLKGMLKSKAELVEKWYKANFPKSVMPELILEL